MAVRTAGEMYQLFNPSGEAVLTDKSGGVVSRRMAPLVEAVFPALSETVASKLYVPSVLAVNAAPPPLMLGNPEIPEVASVAEAEAVTAPEMNQPFNPLAGGMDKVRLGATLSTIIDVEDIVDVSPHEECAQKFKLVLPSGNDQAQAGPLHSIPGLPSKPVMLYPTSGSFPERLRIAVPRHQPFSPGKEQTVVPLTVAGG